MANRAGHWDDVYQTRRLEEMSWFRPHLDVSIDLLERAGLNRSTRIIDVGAGASTLVDDLLVRGVQSITVLDISGAALQVAQDRLGDRAKHVQWMVGDVTSANRVRYVELAISQLRTPPTAETSALRDWSIELLDSQAPVKLPPAAKQQLRSSALLVQLSGRAIGQSNSQGDLSVAPAKGDAP